MRARAAIALAVASAMLMFGASSLGGAAVSAKKVKPCDLITPADIATILGAQGAGPPTQGPPSTATQCQYQFPGANGAVGTLSIGAGPYDKSAKKDLPKNSKEKGAFKIPGIKLGYGFLGGNQGAGNISQVVKGGKTFLVLQVFLEGLTKDQLIKLIKLAYKRA